MTYAASAVCDMANKLQLKTELPFADPDMQMQWRMSVASNVRVYFPHNPRVGDDKQMRLSIATSYITTFGAFAETYIGGANLPTSIEEEFYYQQDTRRFSSPQKLEKHLWQLRDMWLAYDPATEERNHAMDAEGDSEESEVTAPAPAAEVALSVPAETQCAGFDGQGCPTQSTRDVLHHCCMRCHKAHRKLARKQ